MLGDNKMYCVIDIGSNTIRLKVYEYKDGSLKNIFDKKNFAKLASYIDENNYMKQDGIYKCIDVLEEYKQALSHIHVSKLLVFATAAIRNVGNTKEIVSTIKNVVGLDVCVLSGEQEATYDFIGAKKEVDFISGIMVDIGGGSTELIFIENYKIVYKTSIPVGSLNMHAKHVSDIFPTKEEAKKIKEQVLNYIEEVCLEDKPWDNICGIGGSIRGVLKLQNELTKSKENTIGINEINNLVKLYKNNSDKWFKKILKTIPERVYTITVGLIILKTIMNYYGCFNVVVSNSGVREGYLLDYLEKKDVKNDTIHKK